MYKTDTWPIYIYMCKIYRSLPRPVYQPSRLLSKCFLDGFPVAVLNKARMDPAAALSSFRGVGRQSLGLGGWRCLEFRIKSLGFTRVTAGSIYICDMRYVIPAPSQSPCVYAMCALVNLFAPKLYMTAVKRIMRYAICADRILCMRSLLVQGHGSGPNGAGIKSYKNWHLCL